MGSNQSTPSTSTSSSSSSISNTSSIQDKPMAKCKPCCACPETRKSRDECVISNGEESCTDLIQAHQDCMRSMGFAVSSEVVNNNMEATLNNLTKMIPKLGTARLKDLIKSIRACKTAADERSVITKESALIRTSFKEEVIDSRYDNIAKLLYIHMLGYPAHFGQMDCIKLAASPKFTDKRLAYLGIMLLLDENHETLTLVTNCLKNDMNNANVHIVGLALCTLGNIASQEMSRDLASEVERLLAFNNSYVRKKAALCALRMIRKVPDLIEQFLERTRALLNERNHGVLLTGVTLLSEMCVLSPEVTVSLRETVPTLCRHLKGLVSGGSTPEFDVNGISDPFLQVKLLRILRYLGKDDAAASEAMNDVLAQVATSTEASKNAGNAILYEAVLTIMNIESSSSLRVLGINILGRFLANRDNNIKYVALTTLTKTAQRAAATDASALQRHRSTVLECLRDPDISIRRRALDLSFFLINGSNIRILTRELLSFLEIAEGDIKASVANRICDYAGRYRPNKRWEIDTVTRILRVAGSYVDQEVINHFVKLVSTGDPVVHKYSVKKLYHIIKSEGEKAHDQEGLLQAALWCVGEYGHVLVSSGKEGLGFNIEEESEGETSGDQTAPTQAEVVDLLSLILRGPFATSFVKEYGISALLKLAGRFTDELVISNIKGIVDKYRTSMDAEIQQRAVEYTQIFGLDREIRAAVLEQMPVLDSAIAEEALKGTGTSVGSEKSEAKPADLLGTDLNSLNIGTAPATSTAAADVFSLMFGDVPPSTIPVETGPKNDIMNLLGGIVPTAIPVQSSKADVLGDLFGSSKPILPILKKEESKASVVESKTYKAYDKNGLCITLLPTRDGTIVNCLANFSHTTGGPISNISFQVAVPKSLKLVIQPPSGTTVSPGISATQALTIENPTKAPIRLRLKISFVLDGKVFDEIVDFSSFEASLWL